MEEDDPIEVEEAEAADVAMDVAVEDTDRLLKLPIV